MGAPAKVWMCWSSGKDSAAALARLAADPAYEVTGLLTTVTADFDRVAMHAVRRELVRAQARRLGLPLREVEIPFPCPNEIYEQKMREAVDAAAAEDVTHMGFGDLYLEDIRAYREKMLADTPLKPVFPLWREPTDRLARQMVEGGIRPVVTCIDPAKLDRSFAGRLFDLSFLDDLPEGIDPCGENGEFHSFVFDAPVFSAPIPIKRGEVVERDGFVFADMRLAPKA